MKSIIHVLDKDKRKRKRVELFSNIQAQLEILGASSAVTIKDVSYSGFGLIVPPNTNMSSIESLEAKLSILNQDFKGTVANKIVLPNQEIKIGFSLPIQIQREIDFNTQDPSWDRVTDAEIVENIYQDLQSKGPEVQIEIKQNFSRATLSPIEIKNSETIICEIIQIRQGFLEKGKAKCMFDLFQTCHAFDTNIEKIDESKVELKLSNTLARLLRRQTVRVLKQKSNLDLTIFLKSKSFKKTISKFEIYDYSEHGLSLIDPNGELSFPRNMNFDEIQIEIKNIGTILGKGEIRSYEWNQSVDAYVIGLSFEVNGEPYLTNWHNFILKARYPNLDFEYQESDHKKIWNLFERSGYLGLKPKESFEIVYDITKKTWEKLKNAGTDVSKRIKIVSNDEILAHIQIDKIYPKTWCVHHLSIDPKASKIIGKEIYSVTTDVILSEGGEYLLSLTEAAKPWNQRAYYDFITNYRFPEHNLTKKLQVFEVDLQKPIENKKFNFQIRQAAKWDLKKIIRYFEANLPVLEREACGLNENNITLEALKNDYSKFDLQRDRNFLVAIDVNDDLLGFSRIETGTTGVNIFGLLDLLFIYSPVSDVTKRGEIFDALIHKSLEFFQKIGKKDIILILDDDRIEHYQKLGYFYIWDGILWIAKKDILPRYHAYTQLLYGHLILKREKIRNKKDAKRKT